MTLRTSYSHLLLCHVTVVLSKPVDGLHEVLVSEPIQFGRVSLLLVGICESEAVRVVHTLVDLVGHVLLDDPVRLRL